MDRRALLGRGVVLAGAMSTAPLGSLTGAAAEPSTDTPLTDAPWSLEPGATIQPYEQPSRFGANGSYFGLASFGLQIVGIR